MSQFKVELVNTEINKVRTLDLHIADAKKDKVYDFANAQMDIWGWNKRARQIRTITPVKEKRGV
jgi:hypothetical protein